MLATAVLLAVPNLGGVLPFCQPLHVGICIQISRKMAMQPSGGADWGGFPAVVAEPPHGWRQRGAHLGGQARIRRRQLLEALYQGCGTAVGTCRSESSMPCDHSHYRLYL